MKNTGKNLIAVALILAVLSVTVIALPLFAEPLKNQTQERGEDCPQTCEPCEDCEPKDLNHDHNYNYKDCGDCDGSMKQTRTKLQGC